MPIRIDKDLLRRSLREEDLVILDRAQDNVDQAVTKVLEDFSKAVDAAANDLIKKDFADETVKKLQVVQKDMEDGLAAVATDLKAIQDKLTALAAAGAGAAGGLTAAVGELSKATGTLEEKLKALKDRAGKLGETTGGAIAGVLRRAIS